MFPKSTRREFLQDSAVVAAAAAIPGFAAAASPADFASRWDQSPDRVWLGSEYWTNPLQDWRVANADRYIESILTGTVRARAVLAAQSGSAMASVRSYIADYLTRFRAPDGELIVPMPAIIGSGARPG